MPRSLEKVLPFCERLDADTRTELEEGWRVWGSTVTTYRDCIHHYAPLDFGMASIDMQEAVPGEQQGLGWRDIVSRAQIEPGLRAEQIGELLNRRESGETSAHRVMLS